MAVSRYISFILLSLLAQASFAQSSTRSIGFKNFEVSNHLNNITEVTSDRKVASSSGILVAHYEPDILSYTDYYPYGMQQENRSNSGDYKFGFQGQEKDETAKGEGNSINYKYRMHDPRVGRFFVVDPLYKKYPYNSQYAFSENTVVNAVELEGLEKEENFNLYGTWRIEKLPDGRLTLIPPSDPQRNQPFKVIDENDIELSHFKYVAFEVWMSGASMKEDVGIFSGNGRTPPEKKVKLETPNAPNNNRKNYVLDEDNNWNLKTSNTDLITSIERTTASINSVLSGTSRIINYSSPSDATSVVNYSISFDGLGGNAPNRFTVRDSNNNIIAGGGDLELDQETNTGILNFSVPAGERFTLTIEGVDDSQATDRYNITTTQSYAVNQ